MDGKYFPPKNLSGPRGLKFVLTTHMQELWIKDGMWGLCPLAFAVKFSRVFARRGDERIALYYPHTQTVFLCVRFTTPAGLRKWSVIKYYDACVVLGTEHTTLSLVLGHYLDNQKEVK